MNSAPTASRRKGEIEGPGATTSGPSPFRGGGMSYQATGWVLEFSESQLGARLVLLAIAYRLNNDSGLCWPSLDTIARECRMTKPGVIQAMERLEASGELTVERSEGGSGNVNRYSMPKFLAWWEEARQIIGKGKNSKRYFDKGKGDTPETVNANEDSVNAIYPNSQKQKEEEQKGNQLLPLEREERKALPKPIKQLKQRRGFEKSSPRPPAPTRIVTNKQPESWIWFSGLFQRMADKVAYSNANMWPLVDEMLAEIDRDEAEERLSIYIDGIDKLTGFAAKDFLEGGWRTIDPADYKMPRLTDPAAKRGQ